MKFPLIALLALILASCATQPPVSQAPQKTLASVSFSSLDGWQQDQVSAALPALRQSCIVLAKQTHWKQPCAALASLPEGDDQAARRYFETWFQPYAITDHGKDDGLFTGYYEAELQGSLQRHDAYQTPIYARPHDLITVNLGDFVADLQGKHITGKVVGSALKPYDERAAISEGSLADRATVLAWVDDPVSAFFLAVQGSGRIQLDNGQTLRVGYDGANGHNYSSIGRALADSGDIEKPVTMQKIRAWMAAHPDRAAAEMDIDKSFVFFRVMSGDQPVGAEGVPLTPRRSMAVDPAFVTLGTPLWLDCSDDYNHIQQVMVAQDTGGAIKGVVRGDMFWGFGADAAAKAGAMQSRGRYFLLLPKTVPVHEG